MILTENIIYLKRHFSQAWGIIKDFEDMAEKDQSAKLIQTQNGQLTCAVQIGETWHYIHSKYDPMAEADRIIKQQKNINDYEHVFFYGVGLGYHIEKFTQYHPNKPISVYEPNVNILNLFLSQKEVKKLAENQLVNFYVETNEEHMDRNLNDFAQKVKDQVLVIVHPAYERIFAEQTKKFIAKFREAVQYRRASITAKVIFSKRLTINALYNLPYLLKTPNLLHDPPFDFKGKPAILVAAGPSLDFEYENLKYIKENGLAYIFSVGSSINSLVEKEIYPDAACTYDGSVKNKQVFDKIVQRGINQIPMFFGSTVGFETLQNYPGPMYNFLVSGDMLSQYYLRRNDKTPLVAVNDAGSIAVITLQLLYKLGFNPVILVGQNLAYLQERRYAGGIDYAASLQVDQDQGAIKVKDVEGKEIFTSPILNIFRKQMESVIQKSKGVTVINTTRGGAHIEGTFYMPLSEVIRKRLSAQVVNKNWGTLEASKYDMGYFEEQARRAVEEKQKFEKVLQSFEQLFAEIEYNLRISNKREIEKCFNKFDKIFDRLIGNVFYTQFIMRMSYLLYENIQKMFEEVRFMTDPIAKAKRVVEEFSKYIEAMRSDASIVEPLMESMHQEVLSLHSDFIQ